MDKTGERLAPRPDAPGVGMLGYEPDRTPLVPVVVWIIGTGVKGYLLHSVLRLLITTVTMGGITPSSTGSYSIDATKQTRL